MTEQLSDERQSEIRELELHREAVKFIQGQCNALERQVSELTTELNQAHQNGYANGKEDGLKEGFAKGVEEGRATQAILELQGRDRFIAELREKESTEMVAVQQAAADNYNEWKREKEAEIEGLRGELARVRGETFKAAIVAARTAFDRQAGDSQSYHDDTLVNAAAMERRVVAALEAAAKETADPTEQSATRKLLAAIKQGQHLASLSNAELVRIVLKLDAANEEEVIEMMNRLDPNWQQTN